MVSQLKRIHAAHLLIGDEIGRGQFKRVCKARYRGRDAVVLKYGKADPGKELEILLRLANSGTAFVPEIFGTCTLVDGIGVVQEFARFGCLKQLLQNPSAAQQLTSAHRLTVGAQLSRAMAFLESEHVVHADLSCRNVLCCRLDADHTHMVVKISDFGLSTVLDGEAVAEVPGFMMINATCEQVHQPRPIRWSSPETVAENRLSHRADVWSLGATLWELFAGGADPWVFWQKRSDVAERLKALAEYAREHQAASDEIAADFPCAACCPSDAHATILSCLCPDEFTRPNFMQVAEKLSKCAPVASVSASVHALNCDEDCDDWVLVDGEASDEEWVCKTIATPRTPAAPLVKCSIMPRGAQMMHERADTGQLVRAR